MKKRFTEIFKYFSLILFITFLGSNIFFNHSHIYDEKIIVHSHPFKPGPDGKPLHHHSKSSYVLVHLLNTYIATACLSIFLASGILSFIRKIYSLLTFNNFADCYKAPLLLRGPPSGILI